MAGYHSLTVKSSRFAAFSPALSALAYCIGVKEKKRMQTCVRPVGQSRKLRMISPN